MGKGRPRAVEKGVPGHCPSSYQAPALPQAPVYYPSETEFLDPLSFIAKIRPEAETYGICRIVPPKGWNPPFALDLSSFSFQTKSQAIHRLQSRPAACDHTTFELEYTRFLENHCGRKPKKRAAVVVFEGEDLSLCSLFNAVKRFGGYDKVLKDKRWGEVFRFVRSDDKKKRIPKITECSKHVLCQLYREHLYDYEQYCSGLNSRGCTRDKDCKRKSSGDGATGSGSCGFKRHRRKNAEIKVERETELDNSDQICEQCKSGLHGDLMLLCDRCNRSWHLYCLTPPLEKVPPGDWYCLECVNSDKDSFGFVLGKRLSLDAFKKVAEKARRKWLGASGSISRSAIERKFWDIVEGSLGMVEVMYGSDLDTSLCGSGFPRERDPLPPSVEPDVWKKYCSSPWNLNNLPKLEGSMLQHIHDNIAGVMVPWLYMGMLFSSFCWHFEDHCFYSMNYLHWGEPKCWYSVPGNEAHAFEQVMRKTLPDLFDAQPDLLFQLVTMLNPSVLQEHGVPVYGALQEPGNFIITFPRSYHGGFNFGLNCAEAVNFAPADWLPHGGFGAELYRLYHKAPVLSHEELLCVLAKGSCSSSVLPYLKEEVSRVFMKEKFCREKLWTNGIVKSSLMSPRKQPEYVSAEEDPTCIVCQQYLFLSAVVCSCRPSAFVCLEHWEHLCECNPSKLCLLYRQTLAELSDLLHKVTPISEGPWSSEVATQSMNCFSEISSCDQSDALIKKVQGGHATYKQLAEDWISTTRQIFEVPFYDNACIDALKAAEQFLWAGHEMDMVRCIVTDLMKAQKWSMDVRNCLSNVETWLNQRNGDRGKVLFTDIVGLLHVDSLPCIEPGYTKLKAFIEDASKLLAKVKSVLSSHTCTTVAALEALYAQTIDLPILLEESRELAREISRKSKSSYGSRLCKTPDHQFMASRSSKSLTPSRKSMPSRLSRVIGNEELKRGSIYRSSESVRKLQGLRTIQSSLNRDVSLTFTIIDSLSRPSKNEGDSLAHKKRSPQITSNTVHSLSYVGKNYIESNYTKCTIPSCNLPADRISTPKKVIDGPPDDFLEICLDSKDAKWCCRESVAGLLEASLTEELKLTCDQTSIPESDGNVLLEREKTENLSKSASAKVGMADWPSQSESNFSKAIPKLRFSPLRRMLGPIKKSKSQRDLPFSTRNADGTTTTSKSPSIMRDVTLRKSLLHDFSKVTHLTESDEALFKNKLQNSVSASSPVHLQGLLKLEYKHDALSFEFSVRDPEEILAAKIWKTDNALNWVYTFYSIAGKKRSNRQKQLLMVGQMQVSCYLCSEMRSGSLDTSTVMEFVLFDVAQARKSLACQEDQAGEGLGASDYEFSSLSETDRRTFPQAHSLLKNGSDSSDAYPWNPTDLRSHLEVAAVVIQVPFEKRESLKGKMGEKVEGTTSPDGDLLCRSTSLKNVTVVTASGTHGLPNTKEGWPSRLLDRWRYGGGCDCGGWDMTCPIVVLNNPSVKNATDPPFAEDPWPPELFVQGSKERIPAVTITATGEGEYSIAFHARLSTLQAFSICVALLHTTEVSATVGQEQNAYRLQCNSLKLLLEEEVKYLVEAVTDEEKRKVTKRKGDVSPYLVPDPPFSPIGRV